MKNEQTIQLEIFKKKKKLEKLLYLLPAIVIFCVFMVWPIIYNVYLSTMEWNMVSPVKTFVGADNYVGVFQDTGFWKALGNTGIYVALMMGMCFVVPYFFSYIMGKLITKGNKGYRALMFFPSLLSLAVAAIVFMWLFNSVSGPVAEIFRAFGHESPQWFTTPGYVILVLSITTAWRCFGYNLIVFLAAIVEVPIELLEAAKLEGASNWKIFWKIVVPLTSPTALYVFIITFVMGLQYVFTPIQMITKGGPNMASTNLVYLIYQYGFQFFQTGRAAAVAIISLIIFLLVLYLQKRLEKRVHYEN
ncbi:MAG: sugar ABC transporter permease [Christensenella sp.]|uniref:carbohydrate ABC transporter permease n=1 Tax=Christensenella sp. TaxID=1935934 RepID=UPI002B1F146D|nr:sugar ABC transporter permease [Christensenella sp.]MEA5002869.1 sugar ABC transporter permease [Christensenella sp.]